MPSTTATSTAAAAEQRAVIRSLSQCVAAELTNRPAVWLRDNSHRSGRNADGTYNGSELVSNLLKSQPPASLPDEMLEGVLAVVETVHADSDRHWLAAADLEAVEARYGSSGLAAIGAELLKHVREWALAEPFNPQHFAEVATGSTEGRRIRTLVTCEGCGRYRMGSKWRQPPMPSGYVRHVMTRVCPKCRG
jgi:hypothetical protein